MLKYAPLSFLVCLLVAGCTLPKDTANGQDMRKCNTLATVKDFTGLDGCTFLIVLDNGDKLLPAKVLNKNFAFANGQRIKFGYKKMDNMASVCMAEKMSVEVTCIELVKETDKPVKPECVKTTNPMGVGWLKQKIEHHAPAQIIRYDYLDGWAYFYKTNGKRSYLYDCQGNLICEVESDIRKCRRQVNNPDDGRVIYERDRKPVKPECYETTNPASVGWMKMKMDQHQPQRIVRFDYLDGWAYFYKTNSKRSYLYDCQGNLICEVEVDIRHCKRQVKNPDSGLVIYNHTLKPVKPECYQTTDPQGVTWMRMKIEEHAPAQIVRYDYLDGWAYFYKTNGKRSYLYDCQGNFLCEVETDVRQCKRRVKNPDKGMVIFELNRKPIKPICYQTRNAVEVEWMSQKIVEHSAREVIRYDYLDGWAYFYKTNGKRSYLYDCQGNLICEVETDIRHCKRKVKNPDQGLVVYQGE